MDKCYGIIYKATNKVNGKIYIGQTIQSLDKRVYDHIYYALNERDDMYFHRAIRKYSEENFIWEIIVECNSLEELNKTEIEMIEKYDAFGNGYNLTDGGEGIVGHKHTEETRRKIGEAQEGEKHHNYGKHHSKKTKKKISESNMGEKNHNFGKHPTEETRRKMGEAQMGEKHYNYGKHRSKETKRKISESTIGSKSSSAKKYIIITPESEEIFVHGLREFCRNYKKERLHFSALVRVAQGKYKQHKGYKCRHWEEKHEI